MVEKGDDNCKCLNKEFWKYIYWFEFQYRIINKIISNVLTNKY